MNVQTEKNTAISAKIATKPLVTTIINIVYVKPSRQSSGQRSLS